MKQRMVRHIHVTLDDDDYEAAEEVKNELELTWADFVVKATEEIKNE